LFRFDSLDVPKESREPFFDETMDPYEHFLDADNDEDEET
jgi:hypothetical protein